MILRAYSFVPFYFSRLSSVFGRLQNPVLLVLSSENGRFRRPPKPSASWAGRLCRLWKDSRSDMFSLWQLGLRASFLSWSLRNLPKSEGPFFWEWKISSAKSTGFRIQLLSTENSWKLLSTENKRIRPKILVGVLDLKLNVYEEFVAPL